MSTGSKFLIIKGLDTKIPNNKDLRSIFGRFAPLSLQTLAEPDCEGAANQGQKAGGPGVAAMTRPGAVSA